MVEVRNNKRGIKKKAIWVMVAEDRFSGGSTCQITRPKIKAKNMDGKNFFIADIRVNLLYNNRDVYSHCLLSHSFWQALDYVSGDLNFTLPTFYRICRLFQL